MSDGAVGIAGIVVALAFIWAIVWQWRSDDFVDPIFSAFASQAAKRPLMWFTTVLYGIMALGSVYAGVQLLTGK